MRRRRGMRDKYKKLTTEEKIRVLSELWVKWNIEEITGDEFAYEFSKAFRKETLDAWNRRKEVRGDE